MSARKSARPTRSKALAQAQRSPRGQAMVEYSVVTHFLLIGMSPAMMWVMSRLYDGLTKYYDSIFQVLQTGAV